MSDVDHSTKVERAGEVRAGAAKANPTLEGENRSLAELKQGGASCEATGAGATASAGEAGGGTDLGTALRMVLDHGPEQGSSRAEQDDTALRTIEAWPSLADRQQLWQAPALWVERFWGEQQRSSQRWRALVDPLPDAPVVERARTPRGCARAILPRERSSLRRRLEASPLGTGRFTDSSRQHVDDLCRLNHGVCRRTGSRSDPLGTDSNIATDPAS